MKFANTIDRDALKNALKLWTVNESGETAPVLDHIPYTAEMSELVDWCDEPNEWIDTAIGNRLEVNMGKILAGDKDEIDRLDKWAEERTNDILAAYDKVIALLNAEAEKATDPSQNRYQVRLEKAVYFEKFVTVESNNPDNAIRKAVKEDNGEGYAQYDTQVHGHLA